MRETTLQAARRSLSKLSAAMRETTPASAVRGRHGQLDIRLFGHATITIDGVPVKFAKRSTTLAMIAYLVLKRGQPVSRDALAYLMFPEADEATALSELRRYLYRANKSLATPWIVVDAETVRWNAQGGAFVDVLEFDRLSADPQGQERAIELYAGDLLADIYDDWVLAERESFRSRYLTLLKHALDKHRADRQFEKAIGDAKRILLTDPWREDALRDLVALRYESGDTSGALAEYEAFAKRLRDELDVAPMPESVALRQSILRNEAVPGSLNAPTAPSASVSPRVRAGFPFVGRERELGKLQTVWTRAARGSGALVLLRGEAGVGKTRLVSEFARQVQSEGGRVFTGTTSMPELMPYQAIAEALRSALPLLLARPPDAGRRAILSQLVPEIRDPNVSTVASGDRTADQETARVHDALRHAVHRLASPRPLLLVLEDLHWAGSATTEAVGAIVREIGRAPVLIVGTCREEQTPADHPVRALQRSLEIFDNASELAIDRLEPHDVAALLHRVEALRDAGDDLVARLYAQSEGNAFFLTEAIETAIERGVPATATVSKSVAQLIDGRIDSLGAETRTVAELAAVAGLGFTVSLLRDVSNLSAAAVSRGLDELLERRIVREAGARTNVDYVFSHHLIVDAMYRRIDPAFRAQRHQRIARYLESTYHKDDSGLPRQIAMHFERAGNAESAARWYLTAARAATSVYAYADAIDLAGRALALSASDEERASALDIREHARGRRGDREGQRDDIEALDGLSKGNARARFDVTERRVLLARSLGDSDEEGRFVSALGEAAEAVGTDDARARALIYAATHAKLCGRSADGLRLARQALEYYEKLDDLQGQFDSLFLLVEITAHVGETQASQSYIDAMRERSTSLADRAVEARALSMVAAALILRQDYRTSFDLSQRSLEIYLATNDREGEAYSRGRLAATATCLGDYATALREFDRALDAYDSFGNKRGLALTYANRTLLLMKAGLFDEAIDSIHRSSALLDVVHEKRTIAVNQVNESFIHLQRGNLAAAKSLAEKALQTSREIGFPVFEAAALANLGNAERLLGNPGAAIAHMEAGLALRRPIQEAQEFVDDLSDLTLAYVAAGRTADALATACELESLSRTAFAGAMWPHYAWWAMAQGFAAADKSRESRRAAKHAREELERFASHIDGDERRRSFLSLPMNRAIASADAPAR